MFFKQIESQLVQYFKIKNRQLRYLYEIAKSDTIKLCEVKLIIQAMQHIRYDIDSDIDDTNNESEINFITVTIVPNITLPGRPKIINERMHLIALYFYIDIDEKRVKYIETSSGGILPRKPKFQEIIQYFTNCLGFKINDFKYILKQLKLINVVEL